MLSHRDVLRDALCVGGSSSRCWCWLAAPQINIPTATPNVRHPTSDAIQLSSMPTRTARHRKSLRPIAAACAAAMPVLRNRNVHGSGAIAAASPVACHRGAVTIPPTELPPGILRCGPSPRGARHHALFWLRRRRRSGAWRRSTSPSLALRVMTREEFVKKRGQHDQHDHQEQGKTAVRTRHVRRSSCARATWDPQETAQRGLPTFLNLLWPRCRQTASHPLAGMRDWRRRFRTADAGATWAAACRLHCRPLWALARPLCALARPLYVRMPGMRACQGRRQQDIRGGSRGAHAHASARLDGWASVAPHLAPPGDGGAPSPAGRGPSPAPALALSTRGAHPFIPVLSDFYSGRRDFAPTTGH